VEKMGYVFKTGIVEGITTAYPGAGDNNDLAFLLAWRAAGARSGIEPVQTRPPVHYKDRGRLQ
jgi:hypothetical protein